MPKLTTRDDWSVDDYAAFRARVRGSHTVRWSASSYLQGAGMLLENVPIIGGSLTLDASDPTRRRLTMEVGGGEAMAPRSPDDPLVPFGQYLVLRCQVDRVQGGWFPAIKCGEYAIVSHVYERPSQITTIEAVDWSGRVDEFLFAHKQTFKKNRTVSSIVKEIVDDALPDKLYNVHASPNAAVKLDRAFVADAGRGRWEVATEISDLHGGVETFFDALGDLVIRDVITDLNDDVLPSVGPDIGTTSSPVEKVAEGSNLVGITASLTRESAANAIYLNLSGTVTRRARRQNRRREGVETTKTTWSRIVVEQVTNANSPVRWGGPFGRLPIVWDITDVNVGLHGTIEGAVNRYERKARSMLTRRRGVIRYLDFDMVGGYQLEPDDKIELTFGGRTEHHFVQSVTHDLSGKTATRLRTRQLATQDPGAGV